MHTAHGSCGHPITGGNGATSSHWAKGQVRVVVSVLHSIEPRFVVGAVELGIGRSLAHSRIRSNSAGLTPYPRTNKPHHVKNSPNSPALPTERPQRDDAPDHTSRCFEGVLKDQFHYEHSCDVDNALCSCTVFNGIFSIPRAFVLLILTWAHGPAWQFGCKWK